MPASKMVLSNKKLKQKLRAELAEKTAKPQTQKKLRAELAEKTAKPQTQKNSTGDCPTNSEPQNSLKQLLDSATQRPRLSKREKRRKVRTSEHPEAAKEGGDGGGAEEEKVRGETVKDGSEDLGKKKKRKKRKRKVEQDSGNGEDAKKSQKKDKKKKKKKKPKQKKPKMEAGNSTDAGSNVTEVTGSEGCDVTEETGFSKSSSSQGNGNDPTKVYVGGMPYYSSEDDIRSYFDGCGTITEVDCMAFPDSGKFRGIAIISFKTEAAAKRALALDGADMGGFFLKILPYKTTRAAKASDFAPKMVEGYNRIYVGNLSWDITEEELKKFFLDCNISYIRFGMNKGTGEFKGYAHVDFADSKSLKTALTLDQKVLFGRPVRITYAVPLKKPGSQTSHASSVATEKVVENQQPSSVGGKIRRTCYECGEKGHLSSACPKKQTVDSTTS